MLASAVRRRLPGVWAKPSAYSIKDAGVSLALAGGNLIARVPRPKHERLAMIPAEDISAVVRSHILRKTKACCEDPEEDRGLR